MAHQAATNLQGGGSLPLGWEAALLRDLAPLIPIPDGVAVHLAIMREPYMGRVADGSKTVESRWGKVQCAPHGQVRRHDVIIFQRSGGPILGWCRVARAVTYRLPQETTAEQLVAAYRNQLGVEDAFAAGVADKRYATLILLWPYTAINAARLTTGKRDRRGWVVLRGRP